MAKKKRTAKKQKFPFLTLSLIFTVGIYILSLSYKITSPTQYNNIKVEVLNGCDIQNLARITTDYLRTKGFDVINYDNAAEEQIRTAVIDRLSPEKKWAKMVAEALQVDLTSAVIDSNLCVHALVLLGKDYDKVLPKQILSDRRLVDKE